MFDIEILQAINDWQRGGDARQKRRRGKRLKEVASGLPREFRHTALCCFRQVALDKRYVWKLHDSLHLTETISSWTLATDIAKVFKGGVPPEGQGFQGIIFEIVPPTDSVIINLDALYRDSAFRNACEVLRSQLNGYADGIGKYGDSQSEVVLQIKSLPISAIYAYGGHSSSKEVIARQLFGHEPSEEEWSMFDRWLEASPRKLGPYWICGEVKDRVITKALKTVEVLKEP